MRWMKFCLLALMLSMANAAFAAVGVFYDAVGEVKAAVGAARPIHVFKNDPLENNTIVTTGDKSYAVLKFEDGQVVALQANSSFHVQDYRYDAKNVEKSNILFSMIKGGLRAITGLIGSRQMSAFKLATPNATIGIRGTEFMLAMMNESLYGQVASGAVSMTNAAGSVVFTAGQSALVASAAALPTVISAAAIPAGTFTQLGAIPVPAATPTTVPGGGATSGAAEGTTAISGGAATGASGTTAAAAAGAGTGGAVAIGAAVAAGIAISSTTTTTHH